MNKHLTGVIGVALAAAMLFPSPAFADHRPGNVVVMGGTLSLTGRYAVQGGRHLNVRNLYVDELNGRGGLLGHKVELKIYDDKSDRRTAIELYEKLITEDRVDIVLGPYSSHLSDPVANVMERYKRPFIPHGSNPVIWQRGRKYVFRIVGRDAREYQKGALHLAKKIGVKRIAIISPTDFAARAFLSGALEWARKLGLEIVFQERYRKEQTDFAPLLRKIEASGAEAIFANTFYRDSVALIRQLRELAINVKMFAATVGPALPKFVEELGGTAEYVVGSSEWEPKPHLLGHPGMKEFIESYERRYGVKPNYHVADGYAAMQIYEAAVKRAGSFDPEKVRDALASIAVYTVKGQYKANEQGWSAIYDDVTFQIQNGKRVILWPEHMAEARFLPMPKWADRAKK